MTRDVSNFSLAESNRPRLEAEAHFHHAEELLAGGEMFLYRGEPCIYSGLYLADTFENHSYNKFNLLVADPLTALVFSWAGKDLETFDLRPGVYEVNNIVFDGIERPNPGVANERWLEREEGRWTEHPMVCRHGDGYGTRCSHKLLVHRDGLEKSSVWHLEGHPCEGHFDQVFGAPGG